MGIAEDIKELKELIKSEKLKEHEKKFKFPFGKKVGKLQKKKNFVTVLILNENQLYEFKKYQIQDQTILHELIPRIATKSHVMMDKKGNPLIILPNWSVEPFSPPLDKGTNINGYKLLLNKMLLSGVSPKIKANAMIKWIIILILGGIGLYALLGG